MAEPDRPEKNFRTALPQILATMAKNLLLFGYGLTLGFPTIVIPALQRPDSDIHLTKEEESWIGSINLITVPLGCLVSGLVTQPFGRKKSMQALNIPFFITWILFYYADSVALLYASLALTGLAGGLLEAPVLTYVAEITQPHLRGFLSATSSLSVIVGMFTQFVLGTFLHWRTLSLINASAPIMAFIALCFIPESPHWLIGKERVSDAEKSLCWLRGWVTPKEIQSELQELILAVRPSLVDSKKRPKPDWKETLGRYKHRTFYLPFLLISYSFFAGHFSGMTTLTTFAVNIFATMGVPMNSYLATMILGIIQMLGALSCVVLIHYTGKRPLAFVSTLGAGCFFTLVSIYGYFYLGVSTLDNGAFYQEKFPEQNEYSWVPMLGLIGGAFFAYMGIRLLPWILIGEVFPPEIRAFASGCCGSMGYIFGFTSNKTFFALIDLLSLPGVYAFYGGVGLVSFTMCYFFLPETEGWSLLEVQQHFAGDKNLIKAGRRKKRKVVGVGVDNPVRVSDEVSKL